MASESSFDIVSKVDRQEIDNALNQTAKELSQRYDFKGTGASIAWQGEMGIEVRANSEERAKAALDVFKDKLVKRKVSLKHLDAGDPEASGKEYKISGTLSQGISQEHAKKIGKIIRDEGPKGVKAQIQGDELRVTSKSRDDLQSIQRLLDGKDLEVALQYVEDLQVSDGVHTFVFPTTTGSRYQPGDLVEAPLVASETPWRALTLDLVVQSGAPIASLWSDGYGIDVLEESTEHVHAALSQPALPNADVVIQWKLAVEEPRVTTITSRDSKGTPYVGLTLHPPATGATLPARPRELVFVLDASCSMSGQPWLDATATVELAIGALRPDERFNLIRFGDDATAAFPEPVAVDPRSVQKARTWLRANAAGGGTNMTAGVVRALDMPGDPEALRMLVLLTDGYIGGEQDFFKTVHDHLTPNDRIFALGIGSSVNRHLLEGLAHHGRGAVQVQDHTVGRQACA